MQFQAHAVMSVIKILFVEVQDVERELKLMIRNLDSIK